MHNDQRNRDRKTADKARVYTGFWKGSGDSMHNSNVSNRNCFMEFRAVAIRQFWAFKGWHKRLLRGERQWPMRLHYAMWVSIFLIIIALGALDAGRKDMIKQHAKHDGQADVVSMFLKKTTLKQWSDIDI